MLTYKHVDSDDLAIAMKDVLSSKTASVKTATVALNDLNRSCEILEELGEVKAAEIVTKIIEKISGK